MAAFTPKEIVVGEEPHWKPEPLMNTPERPVVGPDPGTTLVMLSVEAAV